MHVSVVKTPRPAYASRCQLCQRSVMLQLLQPIVLLNPASLEEGLLLNFLLQLKFPTLNKVLQGLCLGG